MRTKVATAEATARQSKADADAAAATAKCGRRWTLNARRNCGRQNTISQRELDAAQTADTEGTGEFGRRQTKSHRG